MKLKRNGREYYHLQIDTDPAITGGWEMSIDGGSTWISGEAVDGGARWLLRGPTFVQGGNIPAAASTPITTSVRPQIRAIDTPEVVVRDAPTIRLD